MGSLFARVEDGNDATHDSLGSNGRETVGSRTQPAYHRTLLIVRAFRP
jgi:hypothetical protein